MQKQNIGWPMNATLPPYSITLKSEPYGRCRLVDTTWWLIWVCPMQAAAHLNVFFPTLRGSTVRSTKHYYNSYLSVGDDWRSTEYYYGVGRLLSVDSGFRLYVYYSRVTNAANFFRLGSRHSIRGIRRTGYLRRIEARRRSRERKKIRWADIHTEL